MSRGSAIKTIDDVVVGLQRLDRELPAQDGVATQAEVLWSVWSVPRLRRRLVDSLDRFVAFAGRGMLFPAPDLQTPRR